MWKALIKLQIRSYFGSIGKDRKKGTRRSPIAMIGIGILALYLFVLFAGMFFGLGWLLAEPFATQGILWFYFLIAALAATLLGVLSSAFFAKTHLFEAKDNELLLAMPIPPMYILLTRLLVLYVQTMLSEAIVLVPMYVACLLVVTPTFGMLLGMVLMLLFLPSLAVTLSCLIARLLVFLSARIQNKGIVTILLLVVSLGIYFPIYFGLMDYMQMLLVNAPHLAEIIVANLYPLYVLGAAFTGSPLSLLVMTAILLAIGAFCIWYMSRNFFAITTTKRGFAKQKKQARATDLRSLFTALLMRELHRLWTCPIYLVNCSFGGIFAVIGGVAIVVFSGQVQDMLTMVPALSEYLAVVLLGMIAFLNSICTTAPSVSLEGKQIWILQTAPVPAKTVLWAKAAVNLLVVGLPVLLLTVVSCIVLHIPLTTTILLMASAILLAFFGGLLGLLANLLLPKLDWASEAVPVKQGMSVLVAMLANYTLVIGFALLYIFTSITPIPFIILCNTVLLVLSIVCVYLINAWGSRRFATLH